MSDGCNQALGNELDALVKRWERWRIASFWMGLNLLTLVIGIAQLAG